MARQRILVVEDDEPMRQFYESFFARGHPDEFAPILAGDAEQALRALEREALDLVVLDWVMPGLSGLSILRAIRASPKTRELGVLMVTARSAPMDTVRALESGADDFLSKPFDGRVLLARLRSLTRRGRALPGWGRTYELPGLRWNPEGDGLYMGNRRVRLNRKESELLEIFLRRPNMIHSASYLWETVWGYDSDGRDHILGTFLWSLRRKLGQRWGPRLITIRGRGYLFDGG